MVALLDQEQGPGHVCDFKETGGPLKHTGALRTPHPSPQEAESQHLFPTRESRD